MQYVPQNLIESWLSVISGTTVAYILFSEQKLLPFLWSWPKLCMQYFSKASLSVLVYVDFEEKENEWLYLLRAQL